MNQDNPADILAIEKKYIWHHQIQYRADSEPIIMVEGKGVHLTDIYGKDYLDSSSGGSWIVNVGYGCEKIVRAVREEVMTLNYAVHPFGNIPLVKFAEKLTDKMPGMSRVYLANTGAEANEKAFQIVRQISRTKHDGKKYKILYRNRDYHGATIAALSACGCQERKKFYGPFPPGFAEFPAYSSYRHPYSANTSLGEKFARELEKVVQKEDPDTVGAIVLEPIASEGGIIVPPDGYYETISEICKKYDLLLIMDEMVCGLGRTGKWFGYQHFNVLPDIVTMAGCLTSGYAAVSCTVTTEEVFKDFISDLGDDQNLLCEGSPIAGCTLGLAAALANIEVIEEEKLLENVSQMGEYLLGRLNELQDKHQVIGDVRGTGLFCGLELVKDRMSKEPVSEADTEKVAAECLKHGVIVGKPVRGFEDVKNTLCLAPPYVVTKSDIDHIVGAVDKALGHLVSKGRVGVDG